MVCNAFIRMPNNTLICRRLKTYRLRNVKLISHQSSIFKSPKISSFAKEGKTGYFLILSSNEKKPLFLSSVRSQVGEIWNSQPTWYTILRLECSHLDVDRFKQELNWVNLLCLCIIEVELTLHCFPQFHLFSNDGETLFNKISNIKKYILANNSGNLVLLLPYGNENIRLWNVQFIYSIMVGAFTYIA